MQVDDDFLEILMCYQTIAKLMRNDDFPADVVRLCLQGVNDRFAEALGGVRRDVSLRLVTV